MRKQKIEVAKSSKSINPIKVYINEKTTVTIREMSSFQIWLKRFPGARIIPDKN